MGLGQPLLAQEDILKEFAANRSERRYALYPSTLRMINIQKNEAFNELATSMEKFLIYDLDSISTANKSFGTMLDTYRTIGFEEYMSILGDGNSVVLLGKEKGTNELVGVVGQDDQLFAFFLKGNIAWQKIPTILRTMQDDDLLNVLDIKPERD